MLNVFVKSFSNLDTQELYQILRLRSEVFVVEQDCVYLDLDNKDQIALHVIGKMEGKIIAYTRIFEAGLYFNEPSIGRVVVDNNFRHLGLGHEIMKASIKTIHEKFNSSEIKISAQTYLNKFYNSLGFYEVGEEYLEDGIPHIGMIYKLK